MEAGRFERMLPLAGVLFSILMLIGIIAAGEPADTTDSAEKVLDHYDDGKIFIGIICLGLGAVLFLFFLGALRKYLLASGPETAAVLAFAAGVLLVVALAGFASSQFALANAADEKNLSVMQSLNYVDNNNFPPAVIALCVIYLAVAWHALSSRSLPKWLAWVSLVIGILSLAGPIGIIALFLFVPWTFIVSIIVYKRGTAAAV